jgi:hypothetical protein
MNKYCGRALSRLHIAILELFGSKLDGLLNYHTSLVLHFHLWFPGHLETNKSKGRDEQEHATAMPISGG